jgi:hypothetical protein
MDNLPSDLFRKPSLFIPKNSKSVFSSDWEEDPGQTKPIPTKWLTPCVVPNVRFKFVKLELDFNAFKSVKVPVVFNLPPESIPSSRQLVSLTKSFEID